MPDLDKDGRLPLTNKEYAVFQQLAAGIDGLITAEERMETRVRTIPDGWRKLRLIRNMGEKLCQEIFKTFPNNKQRQIAEEWKRMTIRVEVKPGLNLPEQKATGFVTVPLEALEWLEQTVIDWECLTCMKDERERKKCELRAKLEQLYVFELPEVRKGECPFCTMACHGIRGEKVG